MEGVRVRLWSNACKTQSETELRTRSLSTAKNTKRAMSSCHGMHSVTAGC